MKLKISETYEIITEESAQYGDAEERGFNFKDEMMSFSELVDYIQSNGFIWASDSDLSGYTWISTEPEQDYQTGDYESRGLHCDTDYGRDTRASRYWIKALKLADIR